MDKTDVVTLQTQSVAQITEQLPMLDRAALIELAALETAGEAPRSTLQTAIDKQLAALDEKDANPTNDKPNPLAVDGAGEPAAKAAGKLAVTDYRHPDYHGPLNGEQAAWRVLNIKPVEKVRTK
ncbi:hypothetical protein HFP05_03425 [Rhodanobacter denitrificans]|nr:hypothetical protein [Rhodanobacter denitrificans]